MQLAEATERNDAGKCFDIAAQMKAQGVEPNLHTYNMLMFAASIDFRGLDAWAIFDDLILYGFEPNVAIFNTMLNAHRQRSSAYTWGVMEKMQELGVAPNAVTYDHLIRIFTNDNNLEVALRYLQIMKSQKITPSLRTIQSVILLAAKQGYPRLAIDIAVSLEEETIHRVESEIWMSCMAAAANDLWDEGVLRCWKLVVQDFGQSPDEGICQAVLHTAARSGLPDLATDVLRSLQDSGIEWEEHHMAPLIEAFCRADQLKEAIIALDIMRSSDVEPLPGTTQPIVTLISKDIDTLDETWSIFDEMHKEEKPIHVTALNTLVQAAVRLGDLQRAVGSYKSFADYNVTPNRDTFHYLFDGSIATAHRPLGDLLLEDMKALKIEPDNHTYEKMIQLCLTQDNYEDAFFYLEEMKSARHVPPKPIYEALIHKCASSGDVRYHIALDEMKENGYASPLNHDREIEAIFRSAEEALKTRQPIVPMDGAAQRFIETGGLQDNQ